MRRLQPRTASRAAGGTSRGTCAEATPNARSAAPWWAARSLRPSCAAKPASSRARACAGMRAFASARVRSSRL
eukprot:2374996-Alexandrium_andersonii.AAC.1